MSKSRPIVITLVVSLILIFFILAYYGAKYRRGIPVEIEEQVKKTLEVTFINKEIDLKKGISFATWKQLKPVELKLLYQVTVLPWPRAGLPILSVKAFHNKKEIYFYLTWKDESYDSILAMTKFSDACAVMFPLEKITQPETIMMGFLGRVNVWQWKANQDNEYWSKIPTPNSELLTPNSQLQTPEAYADFHYPFEEKETLPVSKTSLESAVSELLSVRVGTVTKKAVQNVEGKGLWEDNLWQVVFKRSLNILDKETDAFFKIGEKRLCAFAVWNGAKGDRGGRKSISDWVEMEIK
jgi:hypothetical protein